MTHAACDMLPQSAKLMQADAAWQIGIHPAGTQKGRVSRTDRFVRSVKSESAELARNALDAAPDAMIIIDGKGVIRFANRQVSVVFGFAREAVVGQPVELLMPARFHAKHVAHREGYFRNLRVRPMGAGPQLLGRRSDGSEFPVEISLSPIGHEQETLVAAAIRDVTERTRIEAEMRYLQSIAETTLSTESTEQLIRALLTRLREALHSDTTTILLAGRPRG